MTDNSGDDFRLSREDIEMFKEMNQLEWDEFVQYNQIPHDYQRKLLASLAVYQVNFTINNNIRPGRRGKDILERFIDSQPNPDFLREEVYNARRFMLSRQSKQLEIKDKIMASLLDVYRVGKQHI